MKGAARDVIDTERTESRAHFTRGLRSERQRENFFGRVNTRFDAVRDAVSEGTGLARTRTGKNSHGAQ